MIDRIEELLAQMAAEDENDGQEDAPDLTEGDARRPAALRRQGVENPADDAPEGNGPAVPEGTAEGPDTLAGEPPQDGDGRAVPQDGDGPELSWLMADDPAALPLPGSVSAGAGDGPGSGTVFQGTAREEPAVPAVREAASGLEALYRQTARETLPPAVLPASGGGQGGFGGRGLEPGSAASLAVDELDRAVRRDSRRYDGEMSIY